MKKTVLLVVLVTIAAYPLPVTAEEEESAVTRNGFRFILPKGWNIPKETQPKGRRKAKEKIMFMTKDGYLLNRVELSSRLLHAEFSHTKKVLAPGMMPQEMAQVVLNDFELNDAMKNFRLIENKPATVAGIPGFRLVFSYRSNGTLHYQTAYYGFQKDDRYYSIVYSAPKRHYYEINAGTFEAIVQQLKLDTGSAGWSPGETGN
jgi:hypothetical protein